MIVKIKLTDFQVSSIKMMNVRIIDRLPNGYCIIETDDYNKKLIEAIIHRKIKRKEIIKNGRN